MNNISASSKRVFALFALAIAIGMFSACEKYSYNPPAVDKNATWSLSNDIQPIFNSNCVSCHGGTVSPNLKEGQSYNSLTKGNYVTSPAESSRLNNQINSPSHAARTTAAEKLKILYWIEQGAKNN